MNSKSVLMMKLNHTPDSTDPEMLASISDGRQRESLCDEAIKSCHKELQKKEIHESDHDIDEIKAVLREKLPIYQRLERICGIKGDSASAGYYRILASAIKVALAAKDHSKEDNPDRQKQSSQGREESKLRKEKRE